MFRNWFAQRRKRSRGVPRERRNFRTFSRYFEQLEDRNLLAAVTWSGTTGNWDVAANWSGSAVPPSTADVTISTASPATITIKAGDVESIHSLTLAANDTLLITGGSLATSAGLTNNGSITVSPGCTLTVSGAYLQSVGATLSMPGGVLGSDPATNSLANPTFESPVAKNSTTPPGSWSTWGTSYLSTQYAFNGAQSLVISGSNSGLVESFSVIAGNSYTLSTYAMTPASNPLTGSANAQMQLLFFDSRGVQISSYNAPNSVVILTSAGATGGPLAGSVGNQGWNHFSTTALAPANAASAKVQLTTQLSGSSGGGAAYFDDIKAGPSSGGLSKLVAGSVSNSGTITVGPTNTITTSGTFTQTSTGTLNVQIGGAPGSSNYGLVNVGGAATLAGTLKSDLVGGYSPTTTDSFIPVEFASATGNFSSYSLPSGSSYQFQGAVTFTNVVESAVPTAPLTVAVNAANLLHPASTNLLGINLTTWDPALPTAQTQQMTAAAGLGLFRFPGGSDSDFYHFNSTTNQYAVDNFVQFVQFITTAGGIGMATLDYGSGSPQEAAAELAYLEGSTTDTTVLGTGIEWGASGQWQNVNWQTVSYWANLRGAAPLATDDGLNFMRIAHPAPITNVKYFEVGNEIYGSWEVDHHGTAGPGGVSTGVAHDPSTYVAFAKQFATLATEIVTTAGLPAISIGIDSGDPTGATDASWTKNVLTIGQQIGFVPGFISDHIYMQPPGSESDSGLLNNTVSSAGNILNWTTRYNGYEALLTAIVPSKAASVAVMATESNSVSYNPGKQTTSLVNGLFTANSIGSLLDSGYNASLDWDLRNSWETGNNNSNLLYGWRKAGDYGLLGDSKVNTAPSTGANIPYPAYFAMQLASKVIAAGGQVVAVSSNYGELDAYAVLQSSGHLTLLVINANPAADLTEQFNLTGYQPGASADVWQYGKAQDAAQSQSGTGSAALAHFGTTLSLNGAGFSYTFPAYSMTVLDLQAGAPAVNLGGAGGNFAVTFVPGAGPVPIVGTSALTLTDSSSPNLIGATVTIGNLLDGAAESLAVANVGANNTINGTNITATFVNGVLTLSGSDTLANYQQVLRTLVYNDTSQNPTLTTRTVIVVITDGVQTSLPATSSVTLAPQADLRLTIDDGQTTEVPGTAISYTIVVSNAGPSNVTGATVTDLLPSTIAAVTYTATSTGGAAGYTASGSGNLGDTVSLPAGSTITYVITATVSAAAMGSLADLATVAAPIGVTDTNPANNSATDTDSLVPQADLQITATDGQTTLIPGTAVVYTIVVSNLGPSNVTGATIADTLPASLTGATYTATATGGATGFSGAGSGNLGNTVNMPVGSAITYVVTATVSAAATGTLANTAAVTAPAGTTDPNPANNTATETNSLVPQADLQIAVTDGLATLIPGTAVTYTIVVSNFGPSNVTGASIVDTLPAALSAVTYTATAAGGASGFTAAGSGNLGDTANLPAGSTVTYLVTATVSSSATGLLANTATVAAPDGMTDSNPANNTATETDALAPQADLQVTLSDSQNSAIPGATVTYTLVVSNLGPSDLTGVTVADPLPAALVAATYTSTATSGVAGFTASGSGDLGDTVDLPSGSSITYVITATIGADATGLLSNTATVAAPAGITDPNTANNSATDIDSLGPQADLQIAVTDGQTAALPGATITYTIIVSNLGPNDVTGATVADTLPGMLTAVTYTATATGVAAGFTASGSGNLGDIVDLSSGSTITYVVTATISAAATGSLVNTATITAPDGITDPNAANNSTTDTDIVVPQADLQITVVDGQTSAVPGTAITYTIVVTSAGPSSVTGASIADVLPATLTGATYTASTTGGATGFTTNGSGNIADTVTMPSGSTITYVVTATISSAATGSLANTATVAMPVGTTDPNIANNSATDTETLAPQADLQITVTDGQVNAVPGTVITYTIMVTNAGPSNAIGATVTDTFATALTSVIYTATATGGATGFITSGSGNIANTVTMPAGSTITYVVTAAVNASATGSLANTATIAAPVGTTDLNSTNNSTMDTETLTPQADLQITVTDGQTSSAAGAAVTYTIVVTNSGPSSVTGAMVTDALPATLTSATYTATTTGGATGFTASGSGSIADSVTLPFGSTITYVVIGTVGTAVTGSLANTATVAAPVGTTDSNLANNSATDTDTLAPLVDLQITVTDGQTAEIPGTTVTYTIVISNAGPSNATGATITDTLPATLTSVTYTATATGGATGYIASGSGSGNITNTVTMPAGSTITYVVKGTIGAAATGSLANTATIAAPAGTIETNPTNNSATDTDTLAPQADLQITITDGQTAEIPGTTVTYTIVVSNVGPSNAIGATVTDTLPATLTSVTYTATATGGATGFITGGSGNIANTVTMPAGSTITYVVKGTISAAATGSLANTATVAAPVGTTDLAAANNSATDTDTLGPQADLQITITDGQTGSAAGAAVTYTIVVTNAGPSNVVGATVTDTLPPTLTAATYTATSTGGATGFVASGSGNIANTVNMPVGSTITYVLKATVGSGATGSLANTTTVAAPVGTTDANSANNSATDTDTLGLQADLRITDTDGQTTAVPGTAITYTIVVTNAGPNPATGVVVTDTLPASATWTATATGGASGFWSSAYGSIANTVSMPSGSTITYIVRMVLSLTATGTLSNSASLAVPAGISDPNTANNSATDSDTVSAPPANPQVDLRITNTDGQTTVVPGAVVTYTIVVTNAGPNTVTGAVITDTLPSTLTGATWTASATGDAAGFWGSSAGNIANTVNMPPGSTITYVLHATASSTASGTLTNTASVATPAGTTDTNTANNSAADADTLVVGISSTTPANGAVGVSKSATITVTFSAPMNASTINASTFVLLNSSGQQIAGTVTYNTSTRTATFTPSAPLSASSTYTVRITGGSSGVKDQNGNALSANSTWSFQTGTN